ncbi:hypothetical protein C9890_0198 [Perkinsus sp. BL_2016]|nr:hypothetical protein C9890_0198 [Perkinsus sp. BL_2016]
MKNGLLHSFKYSGQDVYGVLLSKGNDPEITVPLFHSSCISVPLMRTALSLLECIEDYKIVGVYFASNNSHDVPQVGKTLVNQLMETSKRPIKLYACLLCSSRHENEVAAGDWSALFRGISPEGSKTGETLTIESCDRLQVKEAINACSYQTDIFDFEDFLNDSCVEWIRI